MKDVTVRLGPEFSYRNIWNIAWPIIIGSAAQTILNVINTAFISQLGEVALGAGAIAGLFYLTMIMLSWGFGVGSQVVIARRYGEGRLRMIGRTVTHALLFQWSMAICLFLLLYTNRQSLMDLLVESENVAALGEEFLYYRLWGLFFVHTNFVFRSFYIGMAKTKVITLTTTIMVLVNALFDYLLIFGHLGLPAMGVAGAALSSVLAEISCTLTFLIYTQRRIVWADYRLFSFRVLSGDLFRKLLRTALPLMFQNFMTMLAWLAFFLIIERLGEAELAASNIVRSVYLIMQIPIMGFSSATNTFVSYLMGKGRTEEVLLLLRRTLTFCLCLVGGLSLITAILSHPILGIYTDSPSLLRLCLPVLFLVCGASIVQAASAVLFSAITGTGKTLVGLCIDMLTLVVYLGVAWALAHSTGTSLTRVWCVEFLYGIILSICSLFYLRYGRWRHSKV